jgi:hypothetical protein
VFTGDWVTDDDLVATAPPGRPVHVVGNLRDPGRRADLCAREAIGLARELRRVLEHAGPTNP